MTLDIEAKADIEMFHHLFFTLAPDDKYIRYTIDKAMYLVDETGLAQYNALKEKGFYSTIMGTNMLFSRSAEACASHGEQSLWSADCQLENPS